MRKIFLDDLPHGGEHIPKNRVNWKLSIGYNIKFIYDYISGQFKIIDYNSNKSRLKILYENNEYDIFTGDLIYCKISRILGLIQKEYIYQHNDIIEVNTGKIQILKQIKYKRKNDSVRYYQYKCLKCNQLSISSEYHLKEKCGCPYCTNQKILIGFNDMWTTNPELAKLLINPEDGYKYTQNSNKRVNWKCPDCGNIIKNKKISHINKKLSCPKCSDGISYANKFMFSILKQLNVKFENEKTFDWSQNKRYDFYISSLNCIIEMNGIQHYEQSTRGRSLQEEQENDKLKEELAINNNITNYIILDCRESNMKYIKNNILNSQLNNLFNLSKVDWLECDSFSNKSIIKSICDLWNNNIKSTSKIGKLVGLERGAVRKYLKIGNQLKFCNYTLEESQQYIIQQATKSKLKKVICLNLNKVFNSIKEANMFLNLDNRSGQIGQCCKGKHKTAGKHPETGEPLKWMYYEYYIEQQNKENLIKIS